MSKWESIEQEYLYISQVTVCQKEESYSPTRPGGWLFSRWGNKY